MLRGNGANISTHNIYMGTEKKKNNLRKTKKHKNGGDGEKEIKYVVRKSKLDPENMILQVFVNSAPIPWADFSIVELLRKNMNMVDETLARIRRDKDDEEHNDQEHNDVVYEETLNIGYSKPTME